MDLTSNKALLIAGRDGFPAYGSIDSVTVAGGTIYVCEGMDDLLYAVREGARGARYAFEQAGATLALFSGDGTLHRLSVGYSDGFLSAARVLWNRVEPGAEGIARETTVAELAWCADFSGVKCAQVHRGALYAVIERKGEGRLVRFDARTGACADMGIPNAREVREGADGRLFVGWIDPDLAVAYLSALEPGTDAVRDIVALGLPEGSEPRGLYCDEGKNCVYYTYGGFVRALRLSGGASDSAIMRLPLEGGSVDAVFLSGKYILAHNRGALVRFDAAARYAPVRLRETVRFARPARCGLHRHVRAERPMKRQRRVRMRAHLVRPNA